MLDKAVVSKANLKIFIFYITQESPPKHKFIRAIAIMTFTLSNKIILHIIKEVAGMANDLTINYANFATLNVLSSVYGAYAS